MSNADPCPMCGGAIHMIGPHDTDFDCESLCRLRDPKAWLNARAQQMVDEIQILLAELREPHDQLPT